MSSRFVLRVRLLTAVLLFMSLAIIAKLYLLQVVHGEEYARRAEAQLVSTRNPLLNRGAIYFTDKDQSPILAATLREVEDSSDHQRYYPGGSLAARTLGFVAYNNDDEQKGQLSAGRGFSFMTDEPLNMSYGPKPRSGFTAAEILNTFTEKALADIFFGYGEERYARRIARAVVERREDAPFKTTLELVEVIKDSVPAAYRRGRIHPATRSFQALRIAVNDELGVIEQGVGAAWRLLACGGRIAVITFHSIEDRLVKRMFAALAKKEEAGHQGRLLYKKPLVPSAAEVKANPASRSAKLRAIEKICHEK